MDFKTGTGSGPIKVDTEPPGGAVGLRHGADDSSSIAAAAATSVRCLKGRDAPGEDAADDARCRGGVQGPAVGDDGCLPTIARPGMVARAAGFVGHHAIER